MEHSSSTAGGASMSVADQGCFAASNRFSAGCLKHYAEEGWVLLKGLFDVERDLVPIHRNINKLIELKLNQLGIVPVESGDSAQIRNRDFMQIVCSERDKAGEIYRACRHLLPLHVLSVKEELIELACRYIGTAWINYLPYTAVRIDVLGEENYLFPWHQDYPYTQGSIDGIVIWAPLFDVPVGHGHVRIIPRSHLSGLRQVHLADPGNANRNGARTISIIGEERLDEEPFVEAAVNVGDALVFNTLLLHRSTPSGSGTVRWTFQLRYANFANPDAVRRGWPGGMIEGIGFEKDHPEFVVDR